jgi:outer membrane protein TolC
LKGAPRLALIAILGAAAPAVRAAAEEAPPPVPAPDRPAAPPARAGRTLRLTLGEAVALALRNNLDLRAAGYGPEISRAGLAEANALYDHLFTARVDGGENKSVPVLRQAGDPPQASEDLLRASVGVERLLPTGATLGVEAAADRTFTNSRYTILNPYYDARVGLFLRQPLLRGFGRAVTESGIRAAEDENDFAELDLRRAREDLVRSVETTYWVLVGARGDVEAQRQSVAVAEDLLRLAEARLAAGAGTRVDVSQAAAGVAARRVDLLRAENAERSFEENLLGLLLPRGPDAPGAADARVEPAEDPWKALPPIPRETVEAAVERALLSRSDLRAQRVLVDAAEVDVLRAESDALARLDFEASVAYSGADRNLGSSYSDSLATRENASWSVGLLLEVPLGNRAARARLDRALLSRTRAEARVKALESAAAVRLRNARRDLESAREQIDAAAISTRLAVEQLDAEKERLRNDKSTTFEVLRLETDLTLARRAELRALVDYLTASTRYLHEAGRLLEERGVAPAKGEDAPR